MALQVGTVSDPILFGKLVSGGWTENPTLYAVGMSVLKKSRFTCKFCGFATRQSRKVPHGWMLPVDLKHPAFIARDAEKSICICPFCAASQAINWAVKPIATGRKSEPAPGRLIYLPTMSQEALNRLALTVVSISSARTGAHHSEQESAARDIDATFLALNQELHSAVPVFHEGMDYEFANALALLPEELYSMREEVIGGVRWWPHYKHWVDQGFYWSQATFKPLQSQ